MSGQHIDNIPMDERPVGNYKSRYSEKKTRFKQWFEGIYIFSLISLSLIIIGCTYNGYITSLFEMPEIRAIPANRMLYCISAGLLGGAAFDMKWFYKSIAHNCWNEDRVFWRIFSPFISVILAFVMACALSNNLIYGDGYTAIVIGFSAGYFSDLAAGKMYEVANVIFSSVPHEDKNNKN